MKAPRERHMKRNKETLRFWGGIGVMVLLLFLAAVALTGCSGPAAIAAVEPTATLFSPPPTDIPAPPPGPTPEAMSFPLAVPTHEEEATASDQNCVDCHTDEETLRAMATEDEEADESLSEGEG
jgi:hypothetical protein